MNKLLKYILIGIAVFSIGIASVKADYLDGLQYIGNFTIDNSNSFGQSLSSLGFTNSQGYACFYIHNLGTTSIIWYLHGIDTASIKFQGPGVSYTTYDFFCFFYPDNTWNLYIRNREGNRISANIDSYYISSFNGIESGNPGYSSLQCQTEYNLIPVNEVTPNYCSLNFGMIDPQECPINSGTGAIVRSNLMINDVPYAQNQNINVFIPDFLAWNISFNDLYTVIEVEGYDADAEYIENVIKQEKLTPTNEDFTNMLVGLANFFPYLAIALLFYFLIKVVYKIFK